jgi:hypothetical protein
MSHRSTTTSTSTTTRRGRRSARAVAALAAGAALIASPAAVGATTASAASSCGITWGSLPKTSAPFVMGRVDGVRAGRHACFDRLVIDTTGRPPGFDVRYVTTVTADGSGLPVPVAGGARLAVVVHQGATSIPAMPSVAGFSTFRQVAWAGSFEGYTTVALGVRARLPHRVFTLYDPATNRSRVVVDVAHRW